VQTFRVLPRHSFIQSTHTAALSRTLAHTSTLAHTPVSQCGNNNIEQGALSIRSFESSVSWFLALVQSAPLADISHWVSYSCSYSYRFKTACVCVSVPESVCVSVSDAMVFSYLKRKSAIFTIWQTQMNHSLIRIPREDFHFHWIPPQGNYWSKRNPHINPYNPALKSLQWFTSM